MKDQDKTKEQLINELEKLRRRIGRLEALEAKNLRVATSLRQTEKEKQFILDSILEHVVYHDMEMKVLWANRAACESSGMPLEEIKGHHCYELWAKRSTPCKDCPVKRARETGCSHTLEKKTLDGRHWYIRGSPVVDTNGDIVGMVELTLEITERKRAEKELQKAHEVLERQIEKRTAELLETNRLLKREIEDRKRVEVELLKNRAELSATFDNAPVLMLLVDSQRRVKKANRAVMEFTLRSKEKIIGRPGGEALGCLNSLDDPKGCGFGPACQNCTVRLTVLDTLKTGKVHQQIETRLPLLCGKIQEEMYLLVSTAPLDFPENKMAVICIQDISERKKMENALRKSEKTLEAILMASPVGICLVKNRILEWANQTMYLTLGYEEDSLLGKNTKILYPDVDEYNFVGREFYDKINQKGIGEIETRFVSRNGKQIHCHLQGSPIDPSDFSKGFIVAAMDITERKRTENLIHSLSQMLIQAQERERQMISCELHDSIAQNLSILKINCDTFFDGQSEVVTKLADKMSKSRKLIDRIIMDVRNLAYDLRPPGLEEMGIVKAIEMYCEEFYGNNGINVNFHSTGMKDLNMDFDTGINLYRIVQEGLTNIKKHADADCATIKLVSANPNIILRIEDDGKGFDTKKLETTAKKEKRMGIRSMEERAKLLQGKMRIQSGPGKGTKISIKFPYNSLISHSPDNMG